MTRSAVFVVAGIAFDVLGAPGTTDTHTAFGWRRKYAPEEPIFLVWREH